MSLLTILRGGIAIADSVTKSVQGTVQHSAWTGQDGFGVPTYAAAVPRLAVIDRTTREQRTMTGGLITVYATITFVGPVAANGTAGRVEPIDPRDKIVLADGSTWPIVSSGGFTDPDTGRPMVNDVRLGG